MECFLNQLQRRVHLLLHHLEVCGNTTTLGEILTQIAGPAKNEGGVFFVKKLTCPPKMKEN